MAETEKQKDIYILGIESSCDETAASVVKNGREVLSNVISSQIALHTLYGGVVPEIASRKHIEKINQVIEQALADAHVTLEDITAIAVTWCRRLLPVRMWRPFAAWWSRRWKKRVLRRKIWTALR